jgi:hypothetical protein
MSFRYPPLRFWLDLNRRINLELVAKPEIPQPPKFLILAGWIHSSSLEKTIRWIEIEQWAVDNQLEKLLPQLKDEDYESA